MRKQIWKGYHLILQPIKLAGHTALLTIRWLKKRARQTTTADLYVTNAYGK
jgi:hypothetical protein